MRKKDSSNNYTFGDKNDTFSEAFLVDQFTKIKKIKCNYFGINEKIDYNKFIENVFAHQESPFGGLSVIAQNLIYYNMQNTALKLF